MYKKILAPLDGSKRAENILWHIEQLASCYGASVIFLQVLKPPTRADYAIPHTDLFEKQLDDQKMQAKKYLDDHKDRFMRKNIKSTSRVVFGSVVKELLRAA